MELFLAFHLLERAVEGRVRRPLSGMRLGGQPGDTGTSGATKSFFAWKD